MVIHGLQTCSRSSWARPSEDNSFFAVLKLRVAEPRCRHFQPALTKYALLHAKKIAAQSEPGRTIVSRRLTSPAAVRLIQRDLG